MTDEEPEFQEHEHPTEESVKSDTNLLAWFITLAFGLLFLGLGFAILDGKRQGDENKRLGEENAVILETLSAVVQRLDEQDARIVDLIADGKEANCETLNAGRQNTRDVLLEIVDSLDPEGSADQVREIINSSYEPSDCTDDSG